MLENHHEIRFVMDGVNLAGDTVAEMLFPVNIP